MKNTYTTAELATLNQIQHKINQKYYGVTSVNLAGIRPTSDRARLLAALLKYPGNTRRAYRIVHASSAMQSEFWQFLTYAGLVEPTNSLVQHGYHLTKDGETVAKIVTKNVVLLPIIGNFLKSAPEKLSFEKYEPHRHYSVFMCPYLKYGTHIPFNTGVEEERKAWEEAKKVLITLYKNGYGWHLENEDKRLTKQEITKLTTGKTRFPVDMSPLFTLSWNEIMSTRWDFDRKCPIWNLTEDGVAVAKWLSDSPHALAKVAMKGKK